MTSLRSSDANIVDHSRIAQVVARQRNLGRLSHAALGTEFHVYKAWSHELGSVAIRIPRCKTFATPNVLMESHLLLQQEMTISNLLKEKGFPVASPFELLAVEDGLYILLSEFIENDDGPIGSEHIGEILAELHDIQIPAHLQTAYQHGQEIETLVAARSVQRYEKVRATLPDLPELRVADLLSLMQSEHTGKTALLHMDIRIPNFLARSGEVHALVDWSNALVGDPICELARIEEYSKVNGSGIDMREILNGYGRTASYLQSNAALAYQFDTAVMLFLVFTAVAPDVKNAEATEKRVRGLSLRVFGESTR